jgi:tRNA-dihydrouridine synthase B
MNIEPRVVQIAGSEPKLLTIAAQLCVEKGAQIIDINMGCPAKKVCNKLAGSALMRDPKKIKTILEAVVDSVDVPVTLKIRTGWNPDERNGLEVAHIAENSGIKAITVHGRTRACRFSGQAEYETIAQIKKSISIPVIANGDINSPEKSLEVFRKSKADAVMIGRSSQGKPWIFRELNYYLNEGKHIAPLEKNNVRDTMLEHLFDLYDFYGEQLGVRLARKHLNWYCMYLDDSKDFRSKAVRAIKADEQIGLVKEYFQALD